MKKLTVAILAIIAGSSGYLIKVPVVPISQPSLAPSGWIHLQKLILPLFENVCEQSTNPTICRLSQEFIQSPSNGEFMDPEVITKFQALKSGKGFLPKGEIFSEYNAEHIAELKIIFNVMCNAKTFDTFYKFTAWARQNLNCGLYVNVIYLALLNRRDTERLTLPPPYELLPNYFIRKDIIIQGSSLLAGEEFTPSEGVRDEGNAYTLDANYTANFYDNDDESKLAYFREDIGLNAYYYLGMLKRAPWLNQDVDINSRYGEEMYQMMKQLVARYNLERYSNGLPEQDNLNWDSLSDAPYDPMLVYSNGNEFIHRTSSVELPENEDKALLQTIENNIATVVSHMRETGYNKTQILNHLMEILVTGEKSYDTLARHLFGKALTNNGQPTVFEHYMTSLRDPLIWKLYKKIVDLIDNALKVLPPYTKSELYFPGVEVLNIEVKKMMTNFDYFEFDITEALKIGNGDTAFQVKIGQPRLNHKPFTVKLNISSLVTQKGLVKIYIGPKMIPGEFAKKKHLFSILDFFEVSFKKGSNIITRSSSDMKQFSPDFMSLRTLCKKVEDAQFGLDSLPLTSIESQINFPERLTIPKGTSEGLPLQLFVFIAPFIKATVGGIYSTSNMEFNSAILSPLYPLDLLVDDKILLDLPNALVKDFTVTHKGASKVSNYGGSGATKSWYDKSSGDPTSKQTSYSYGNEPFDYSSKGHFVKDDDDDDVMSVNSNDQLFMNQDYSKKVQDYSSLIERENNLLKVSESFKKQKPYDSKSKRPSYEKPDYSYNRTDSSNEENVTEKSQTESENKMTAKDKEDQVTYKYDEFNQDYVDKKQNKYVDKESTYYVDKQSNYFPAGMEHSLLKASGYDSSKQKGNYNNKSPSYQKPDYSANKTDYKALYKNAWKTTEIPVEIERDRNKTEDLFTKENENEFIKKYEEIVTGDDDTENVKKINILKKVDDNSDEEFAKVIDKGVGDDDENVKNINILKVYKDNNSNEESVKVVPMQKLTVPEEEANSVYNYIASILRGDFKDKKMTTKKQNN